MINLSILFLSYYGYQNSPFISSSGASTKNVNFYSHINFQKSFSNFLYSTHYNYNFHTPSYSFKNSIFSNFLKQSIFIQGNVFIVNQIFELTRQDFDEDPVNIWNCIFRKFNLPDQYGAAIYCTNYMCLYNVFFQDIVSCGGTFYAEGTITANYLTLENVKSNKTACFITQLSVFQNTSNKATKLENILIKNAVSNQNYGFLNNKINTTHLSNSNVTNCEAKMKSGMVECYNTDIFIKFVSFSFIKSQENLISLSSFSKKYQLSYCLFHSIKYYQGLIKTINVEDVCLQFCFFSSSVYNPAKKSKKNEINPQIDTLNCTFLKINSCCFDVKKEEIFKSSQYKYFEFHDNFYNEKKCFEKDTFLNDQYNINIGYSYQRTPTYIANIAPTPSYNFIHDENKKLKKSIDIDTFVNITFIVLCFLIALIFCMLLANNFNFSCNKSQTLFNFKSTREML